MFDYWDTIDYTEVKSPFDNDSFERYEYNLYGDYIDNIFDENISGCSKLLFTLQFVYGKTIEYSRYISKEFQKN